MPPFLSRLKQELFLVPAFSSGLAWEKDRYGFLTFKKGRSLSVVRSEWSEVNEPLQAFVTRLGVRNTLVTVTPPETALINRIAQSEEVPDPAYDTLMEAFCPKGVDHDQVSLDSLPNGREGGLLVSIARETEVAKLVAETEESGLSAARVGCGIYELGMALQEVAGKDFTGAFILVRDSWSGVLLYENGVLSEAERSAAGAIHFRENPRWFLNEILRFMVYFWETKLLKEPVRRVHLSGAEAGMAEAFQKSGFAVEERPASSEILANPMAYALALNSLKGSRKAVNHKQFLGKRAVRIRRLAFGTAILNRFAHPILGAAILLLLVTSALLSFFNNRFEKKHGARRIRVETIKKMDLENRAMGRLLQETVRLKSGNLQPSEILARLSMALPEGLWLSSLRLKDGGGMTVEGVAPGESGVAAFQDALVRETLFHDVRLKYSERIGRPEIRRTSRKDLGESLVRFSFELSMNGKRGGGK